VNLKTYTKDILVFDNPKNEIEKITSRIRESLSLEIKRKGAIIGLSGGIDSSLSLALVVKAIGPERVIGIMLPEKDSSDDSKILALQLAEQFGVKTMEENITPALDGFGCYNRRDEAVANIFPEYNPTDYKMKIGVKQNSLNQKLPPLFILTIVDNKGESKSKLLPVKEYLQIVASSNFKQRCRIL